MRMIFPGGVIWKGHPGNKTVYLTFDDGPEPGVTQFVLNELDKHQVKATFFCIGDNVERHPKLFETLKDAGHRVGNHTMHHPNGWETGTDEYVSEVLQANRLIKSDLFRPPYGKITREQARTLNAKSYRLKEFESEVEQINSDAFKIVMWSVITGDFDEKIDGDDCFDRVVKHTKAGSIIVFHDSQKAFPRLKIALPKTLEWLAGEGYETGLL